MQEKMCCLDFGIASQKYSNDCLSESQLESIMEKCQFTRIHNKAVRIEMFLDTRKIGGNFISEGV